MPRISDDWLDCVVYIYASRSRAESGEAGGGSGFLVTIKSADSEAQCEYAVTNRHVIQERPTPCIRVNNDVESNVDYIETSSADWIVDEVNDLAVYSLGSERIIGDPIDAGEWAIKQSDIQEYQLGPGDEVFMVGRFTTHDGSQKYHPTRIGCWRTPHTHRRRRRHGSPVAIRIPIRRG